MTYLAKDVFFALAEELLAFKGAEEQRCTADDLLDNLPLDLREGIYAELLDAESTAFQNVHEAAAIVAGAYACLPCYRPGRRLHSQRRTLRRYAKRKGWEIPGWFYPAPCALTKAQALVKKPTPQEVPQSKLKVGDRVRYVKESCGAYYKVQHAIGGIGVVQETWPATYPGDANTQFQLDGVEYSQIVSHTALELVC